MTELIQIFGTSLANMGVAGIMLYLYLKKDKRNDDLTDKVVSALDTMNKVVERNNTLMEQNTVMGQNNTKATEANTVATKRLSDRVGEFLRNSKPRK